jgi:hypothetical protein
VLLQGSTRILIYIGLLSVAQTVPKPLLSYLLPFPERSIALVNDWLVHQRAEIDPTCPTQSVTQGTRILIYIDGLLSRANCEAVAIYLLPFSRTFNCTSKTTGWFTKGLKWSQPAYANKVLLKVAHAFLYTLMDFFGVAQTVPNRCYLPSSISRTFNCTENDWLVHQRAEIDPTCPTLTKCYSKVAHAFLYTLMFFQSRKLCPSRCYLTFFHIPRRSVTSKTTGWFKGLKWSTCLR